MSNTALCIHGHFYQPPREDPLTGEIPVEPGATPYHNWNERILAECYAPNALAGNMTRISFNIGPTLFNWLEMADPRTAARIVAQDRLNLRGNGVGNAMAQTYHHTIMPLATLPDKITQTRWGIADFKWRFGHEPEGMWLPETAADNETLSVLADHGIRYTILAPWQAVDHNIDTSYPYIVELPGGRSIVVFFYNQALSTRVSFDSIATIDAGAFLNELVIPQFKHFNEPSAEPEMVMIASDGELYGHHQHFREKFLAYLLDGAVKGTSIEITYPGLWLKKHPAFRTASIVQNSSWSCHHGVTRWMGPCECTPNGEWKAYMRQAFERISNAIDEVYLREVSPIVPDPWELRHRYIYVLQGQTTVEDLASTLAGRHIEGDELQKIRILLCAQNERQRMFTSCGWFFDDFDRIEPRNAVAYAAQAVFLTNRATGVDLTPKALTWLHPVKSWRSDLTADKIFSNHLLHAQENAAALIKCKV
jgi:alpha-amylase/alpha-mannosidase (GH57 family)